MPAINKTRLLSNLRTLAEFGRYKTGVHRPTYSDQDMASRTWLAEKMREAGLAASIDGIGNVIGLGEQPARARLLTGSHSESQNHAGWLDGALGVIYGIETALAFKGDRSTAEFGIDVGAWADEEGHFGSLIGSRSFCGELNDDELTGLKNKHNGTPLTEALARVGLSSRPRARIDAERYVGYFEAHIEQGAVLEREGKSIGIVTSIIGNWQYRIRFFGTQNHAGTTPMRYRRDAGVALVNFCSAVNERFPQIVGPETVWTACRISLLPGAQHIIPGEAELLFQFRDTDAARLRALEQLLMDISRDRDVIGPCQCVVEAMSRSFPSAMAPELQRSIEAAAQRHASGRVMRMASGAGHDAQIFARVLPSAMLFVPSIGGISHHWDENTSDDDIALGCQVYADAAQLMLESHS